MKGATDRYFIALIPPESVCNQVRQWQQELADRYRTIAALRSPPHITLHMPFLWKASREQELVDGFAKYIPTLKALKIDVDGFGAFPPRVVYVNVKPSPALAFLHKELTRFCKTEFDLHNAAYGDLPFHPHITIAFRDLRKPDFVHAWGDFSTREYRIEFQINEISLLKHSGKNWAIHRAFPLG